MRNQLNAYMLNETLIEKIKSPNLSLSGGRNVWLDERGKFNREDNLPAVQLPNILEAYYRNGKPTMILTNNETAEFIASLMVCCIYETQQVTVHFIKPNEVYKILWSNNDIFFEKKDKRKLLTERLKKNFIPLIIGSDFGCDIPLHIYIDNTKYGNNLMERMNEKVEMYIWNLL